MNASSQPAQTSPHGRVTDGLADAFDSANDDDFAIGCECANPALQIEAWGIEAATQPLQRLS